VDSFFDRVTGRWPAGREDYHWHVIPPAVVARALVEPYRELTTGREGLAPVAPEWVHVTLLHSAPVDQLSDGEVAQIVDRVRTRCATVPAFTLTLDRPHIAGVAVECPGRPGAPARRLWQMLAEVTGEVTGGRIPTLPAVYYPHTSLAYGTANGVDHRPMKLWLSDCDAGPVSFPVTQVSLVAQSHDLRYITWRHILDVELGGPVEAQP
jgi:2'-5' RNA ligase